MASIVFLDKPPLPGIDVLALLLEAGASVDEDFGAWRARKGLSGEAWWWERANLAVLMILALRTSLQVARCLLVDELLDFPQLSVNLTEDDEA